MSRLLSPSFPSSNVAPTALGLASRLALARLKQNNIDALPLLKRAKLTQAQLEGEKPIAVNSQIIFLGETSRALRDDWLGVTLAKQLDLRQIGMIYYVAASSHSLGDALRRMVRYGRLVSDALVLHLAQHGGVLRITMSYTGISRYLDRHQAEFFTSVLLRLCRNLVAQRLTPNRATFVHHRQDEAAQSELSLGCEVDFSSPVDGLSFDAKVLELPVVSGDPYLNELMVNLCDEAIKARTLNVGSFRKLVENTVAPLLPHGEATAVNVARKLGVGERTLARRLASDDVTFSMVVDNLRHELALKYMSEGFLSSQIAWLLGFRHSSSFTHACRRWTGKAPSAHRRPNQPC